MTDTQESSNTETRSATRPALGNGLRRSLIVWIAAVVTVEVVVVAALIGYHFGGSGSSNSAQVLVTGTGVVKATPDTVTFQVGVHSENYYVNYALTLNSQRVNALETALVTHGAKRGDMQTSNLSIYRTYDGHGNPTGFGVDNTLSVTVHGIAAAGTAIESAVQAAGNEVQLNGITLSVANSQQLMSEARKMAMQNAHKKAIDLAAGGNESVGSIQHINAVETQYTPIQYSVPSFYDALQSGVPIAPGTQSTTVQVTVTYALEG